MAACQPAGAVGVGVGASGGRAAQAPNRVQAMARTNGRSRDHGRADLAAAKLAASGLLEFAIPCSPSRDVQPSFSPWRSPCRRAPRSCSLRQRRPMRHGRRPHDFVPLVERHRGQRQDRRASILRREHRRGSRRLLGVSTDVAERCELHLSATTRRHDHRWWDKVEVPAGGSASFRADGARTLMRCLKAPLNKGTSFPAIPPFREGGRRHGRGDGRRHCRSAATD